MTNQAIIELLENMLSALNERSRFPYTRPHRKGRSDSYALASEIETALAKLRQGVKP